MKKLHSFLIVGGGLFLLNRARQITSFYLPPHLESYRDAIKSSANRYKLDPLLIAALIQVESSGDSRAIRYESHLNESSYGLMQLLCSTAGELLNTKISDCNVLYSIDLNIDLGSKYLRKQIDRYQGNVSHGIIAYNTGSIRHNKDGSIYDPNAQLLKVWSNHAMYQKRGAK